MDVTRQLEESRNTRLLAEITQQRHSSFVEEGDSGEWVTQSNKVDPKREIEESRDTRLKPRMPRELRLKFLASAWIGMHLSKLPNHR